MANKKRPKVGIGVMILKDEKVLLGKRKGVHGRGEYAFPGGHLEFGESIEECARRECREEVGIEIKDIRFLRLANLKKYIGKHYVDVGLLVKWKSGKPKVLEPHRIESWNWYDPDNLPRPLFATIEQYLKALKTGKNFFDE